jgi:hypothetical protein
MSSVPLKEQLKRPEITVAVIGLLGILATAFLSNWDKLFPVKDVVAATYSGYRPTGDFGTELRYFFDVSGTRQAIQSMQRQLLTNLKTDAISKAPEHADEINKVVAAVEREGISTDDVIRDMLPVYQKHFTLAEVQELNKFYSTEIMQDMVRKIPLITQDAAPIQMKMLNEYMERVDARLRDAS